MSKGLLVLLVALAPASALAEDIVPNTINCAALTKRANGNWYVGADTTFDIGATKALTIGSEEIGPRFMKVGGADLYEVIEAKCGKK